MVTGNTASGGHERVVTATNAIFFEAQPASELKEHKTPDGRDCPTRRGVITRVLEYGRKAEITCDCGTIVNESY